MKGIMRGAIVIAAILSTLKPVWAWGPIGHRTIATIAQKRLSPAARKEIEALLGPGVGLDQIATCADGVLHSAGPMPCSSFVLDPKDFKTSGPWHYLNVPPAATPFSTPLASYCPDGVNCPINQIRLQLAVLKDPNSSQIQKQIALMFIVHFVGDIHMPLHVCPDLGDMGRNKKMLTYLGKSINLHALWDGLFSTDDFPTQDKTSPAPWVARIEKVISSQKTSQWTKGDMVERTGWESFVIARNVIDPDYAREQTLDDSYRVRMEPIVEKRLAMAAVRLAAILERPLVSASRSTRPKPAGQLRFRQAFKSLRFE